MAANKERGSNPVEVLTFSGFCSQLLKLRSLLRWSWLTWFQIRSSIYETFHISLYNKETVCSFQEIVGGHCGFQTKERSKSVEVLPLLQCKRNIGAHKSALALTGVENEVDLILSRASMFAPPWNVEKLNICHRHLALAGDSPHLNVPFLTFFQVTAPKPRNDWRLKEG